MSTILQCFMLMIVMIGAIFAMPLGDVLGQSKIAFMTTDEAKRLVNSNKFERARRAQPSISRNMARIEECFRHPNRCLSLLRSTSRPYIVVQRIVSS